MTSPFPPHTPASKTSSSKDTLEDLTSALASLQDPQEFRRFLSDLCTPAELRALSERWHVATILDAGTLSYRDINAQTGVSTTTIGRVARFLRDEPHQGYRTALDRRKQTQNDETNQKTNTMDSSS